MRKGWLVRQLSPSTHSLLDLVDDELKWLSSETSRLESSILFLEGLNDKAQRRFTVNGQIDSSFNGGRLILPNSIVSDGALLFDDTASTFDVDGMGRSIAPSLNGIARLTPDGQLV